MERAVIVEKLVKNFEVIVKRPGLIGAFGNIISPSKKKVEALKGVSFSVGEGELVGFIGPNGAGKTTTLKILSGILYPTQGFVQVVGYTPWERNFNYLKNMSLIMGQKNQLWWDLPAIETLELNKAIYEIPKRTYQKNLEELSNLLDVKDFLSIPVRRLSLGQRMRLELIAALLHRPKIIFLDEPTIGLDVIAQEKMRGFIAEYNKRYKATILLTSHNMDDVANLAKRVLVINEGAIVFDGNLNELVLKFAKEKIIKIYLSKTSATREIDAKKFEQIGKVRKFRYPEVIISVPRKVAKVAAAEILQNFSVEDLNIEEEPIESVIGRVFNAGKNINE